MLITVDMLKIALGLPPDADPVLDQKLEQSSLLAQTLVESYIGGPIEPTAQSVSYFDLEYEKRFFLPHHPVVSVESVTKDGRLLATPADYRVDLRGGALVFDLCHAPERCCAPWAASLDVAYTSGFAPVPADLMAAVLNIAIAIYNNGAVVAGDTGGSGELKSMTMFDAMSMSFDVGAAEDKSATGFLHTWKVVLSKYRMEHPVLA